MPLAPVTPDCSSRAACRYGRLPPIPAPPREPGSLPRQRFDNRRCQPAWDRSRDAHPGLSRKFDLDRRRRRTLGSIPDRGDQYRGKTMADPDLPSPAINLPGANLRAASNLRNHCTRRQARGNNRPLLLGAPATPPFRTGDDLKSRHRTVSSISANTIVCTGAYQPKPQTLRKAAITGRLPLDTALAASDRLSAGRSRARSATIQVSP